MTNNMQKYDIIGDIHGHADPLQALLERLGYREVEGTYAHPDRKVIFLGDYIDRGPEIRKVLQIVIRSATTTSRSRTSSSPPVTRPFSRWQEIRFAPPRHFSIWVAMW
jgi:hypothetical protein